MNSIISRVLCFVYFVWLLLHLYLLHTALVICALKNNLFIRQPLLALEVFYDNALYISTFTYLLTYLLID